MLHCFTATLSEITTNRLIISVTTEDKVHKNVAGPRTSMSLSLRLCLSFRDTVVVISWGAEITGLVGGCINGISFIKTAIQGCKIRKRREDGGAVACQCQNEDESHHITWRRYTSRGRHHDHRGNNNDQHGDIQSLSSACTTYMWITKNKSFSFLESKVHCTVHKLHADTLYLWSRWCAWYPHYQRSRFSAHRFMSVIGLWL